MSDDKTKKGSPDNDMISLNQEYEVQYWTNKFGVSKEILIEAVEATGSNSVKIVKEWLYDSGWINEPQ